MSLQVNNYQHFIDWLEQPIGQQFLQFELAIIQTMLDQLHGNHLLLLGNTRYDKVATFGNFSHYWQQDLALLDKPLPFDEQTFNMIVMPHCLDFVGQADLLVKELARLLQGEGYLLVTGFNPYGRFGWRWPMAKKPVGILAKHRYLGLEQLQQILHANDFCCAQLQRYTYKMTRNKTWQWQRQHYFWQTSDYFICLAHKREEAVRPLPLRAAESKAPVMASWSKQ